MAQNIKIIRDVNYPGPITGRSNKNSDLTRIKTNTNFEDQRGYANAQLLLPFINHNSADMFQEIMTSKGYSTKLRELRIQCENKKSVGLDFVFEKLALKSMSKAYNFSSNLLLLIFAYILYDPNDCKDDYCFSLINSSDYTAQQAFDLAYKIHSKIEQDIIGVKSHFYERVNVLNKNVKKEIGDIGI